MDTKVPTTVGFGSAIWLGKAVSRYKFCIVTETAELRVLYRNTLQCIVTSGLQKAWGLPALGPVRPDGL